MGTFCLLLSPGLVGVEVGECLEIGVESWLLEPVPLAERGKQRRDIVDKKRRTERYALESVSGRVRLELRRHLASAWRDAGGLVLFLPLLDDIVFTHSGC